jgi:predicted Zn-dependent protease
VRNKKYIINIYRKDTKALMNYFADKELISSAEIDRYLDAMTNEISNKNPELKKLSPHFFFSRANWPNAYSTGEGTIVFNIDLFAKLKNESQVVFVLCHELAHFYMDHGNKQIEKYINTIYSDEFQKKLKALKKTEYNRNKELEKLELSFASKHFRHSREFESEADSMGLVFMQNTGYDCREALSCLALLDEIDEESIDIASQLLKLFSFDGYPSKAGGRLKKNHFSDLPISKMKKGKWKILLKHILIVKPG